MTWENIRLDVEDRVATVTLDRPEALNAFAGTMRADLLAALDEAATGARVIVITGAGRAFSSGGDVRFMAKLRRAELSESVETLAQLIDQGKAVVRRLRDLSVPTIACLNGVAAGAGLGLALACDMRIASSDARLAASFSRIGLHPDWGTSYFLTRLAGAAVARELVFTGRAVSAEEAHRLGLVNHVVDPSELAARTKALATELAASAPLSIHHAKRAIALAETASLEEVLEIEAEAQLACFQSDDALEGIQAFEEKRRPSFKGNPS